MEVSCQKGQFWEECGPWEFFTLVTRTPVEDVLTNRDYCTARCVYVGGWVLLPLTWRVRGTDMYVYICKGPKIPHVLLC